MKQLGRQIIEREMVAIQLSNRVGMLYCKHEDRRVRMAGKAGPSFGMAG